MTWHRRSNNKRKQRIYQSFQEKISFENNFPRPQRTYSKTPSSVIFRQKVLVSQKKFPMEINTPAIVYMTKLFRCLPKREKGWSQFRCERNILRIAAKNHINHIIIHHISLLACDWSKRITRLHTPQQKQENIRRDTSPKWYSSTVKPYVNDNKSVRSNLILDNRAFRSCYRWRDMFVCLFVCS